MSLSARVVRISFRNVGLQTVGRCLLSIGMAVTLSACESDGDSPTKPSPSWVVEPSPNTATDLDQIAIRVQVRMRVTGGLSELADAVQAGRATAEVCADGCSSDTIVPGPVPGACDRAVGAGTPELAAVWLANDEVGVDFCVPNLTTAQTYTTTLMDGEQQSNAVTTTCGLSAGFLDCVSQ